MQKAPGMFQDDPFLLHPRPEEDELLSSWLIRISHALSTLPETMALLYFPANKQGLWSDDIDVSADEELIRLLAAKSGFDHQVLLGLTLLPYMAKGVNEQYPVCLVESLGRRTSVKTRPGLRFCPICLREDRVPYFRRKWRLSFVTACPDHSCYLWDSCPACGMPINPHRSPDGLPYPSCHRCGFDLRKAPIQPLREHEMKAVRYLCAILDSGRIDLGSSQCSSLDFFTVFRQLIKIACYWGCNRGFFEQKEFAGTQTMKRPAFFFDSSSIMERHVVFATAVHLFEEFPDRLLSFLQEQYLSPTELTKDLQHIPLWHDIMTIHESRRRSPSRTPVNYLHFTSSKYVWCTSIENITRMSLWAVARIAIL